MEIIIKDPNKSVDATEIKNKLYKLNVGEILKIETPTVVRIYERIL